MFRLVRFFLLTSAAAVVAIVIAFVIYRQNEVQRLIDFAEQQNVELARSFANTIWPGFSSFVMSASGAEVNNQTGSEQTQALARAVEAATVGLPVLKVKIYNLEGLTVYSSNSAEIGEYKTKNPGFFSAARTGQPASKLTFRGAISSFEQTIQERDVVESYIPIRQSEGPVEGVFEIYTVVTPLLVSMRRSTKNLWIGFLPVFGLLYGALFLVVRRADQTIKQQYADITEKNAALKEAQDRLEMRVAERTRTLTEEVAERKRMQDKVQQHRAELAHVGRVSMIGEMAASLAHELNQPLTVISGCAQFCLNNLRGGAATQEKLFDAMEQTVEQAERATKIIGRVRNFIHKEEPGKERIDVNDAIRDIATLLCSDAREHGVEVKLGLADTMLPVDADPIQLQQVVLNLAHNGIEAMTETEAGSRHLYIETHGHGNGGVEVTIRDQGNGIPSEIREHLFDPFVTTKPHGLGMGLSISRSIIEAHGGRLWVATDRTDGSTFHFTLPASEGSSSDGK
jgi:C4-dicarboxylate-specific signal transduction histidine kinase